LNIKVKPKHLDKATPEALQLNGYIIKEWENSLDLKTALLNYLEKAKDAIFCAHNTNFDLPFIKQACIQIGANNTLGYHCAEFIGLKAELTVHRAINGAMLGYEILRKIASGS